jgi:peptidoglycan/xylan/chitin deacetylase (PgdA/CDA1 family)
MARLPILMYHNVVTNEKLSVGLSIWVDKLEAQFQYLVQNNYSTFHFYELDKANKLPQKSVVLTFDDVTENQLLFAAPLLEKYNLKATFFIPFQYIGKTDLWNNDSSTKIMTLEQLQLLKQNFIELGHHSFKHRGYASLTEVEIEEDFKNCYDYIKQAGLTVSPVLAYPYGNFPKKGIQNKVFKKILQKNNIKYGLRIGNRVSSFPFTNPYAIKRIDIKGEDSLFVFKIKLKIGKLRLF